MKFIPSLSSNIIRSKSHLAMFLTLGLLLVGLGGSTLLALSVQDPRGRASEGDLIVCDEVAPLATESGELTPIPTTTEERESRKDEIRRELAQRREELRERARELRENARTRRDEIKERLQERKRKIKELARTDARAAIEEIESDDIEESIEISTQDCIEKEKTITGQVIRVTGDELVYDPERVIEEVVITNENESIQLFGVDEDEVEELQSAVQVEVTGYEVDDDIIVDPSNPESIKVESAPDETSSNVLAAADASQAAPWKVLVMIYRNTDAAYGSSRMTTSMPQWLVDGTVNAVRRMQSGLPGNSNGYAKMEMDIVYPASPIKSLTNYGGGYRVDPGNVKSDLNSYAPKGKYDSIFVVWRKDNGYQEIPTPGAWGWGWGPGDQSNGATFASMWAPNWGYHSTYPEGGFVHEWLHGVVGHYVQKGFREAPVHGAENWGYTDWDNWMTWYRDLMSNTARNKITGQAIQGITPEMWKSATPTGRKGTAGTTTSPTKTPTPTNRPPTPTPDTRRFTISGVVEDTQGSAVRGATVTFYKKTSSGQYDQRCCSMSSDDSGRFTLTDRTPGEYRATISAPSGYRISGSAEQTFTLNRNVTLSFTLIAPTATPTTRLNQPTATRVPTKAPTAISGRPDLVVESFVLTDVNGVVKSTFKVGERIYVKTVLANIGSAAGDTSSGYTNSALYINRPSTITVGNLPAEPSDFYMRNGEFGAGFRKEYGSYPSHTYDGYFTNRKSWEIDVQG